MSPFTLFFARLTELLGAENSAQLVREFAGQTIRFPITDHYGFPVNAPVIGEHYVRPVVDSKTTPLTGLPDLTARFANEFGAAGLQTLPHQLRIASQALLRLATVLEPLHSIEPSELEALLSGRVGS